VATHRVPDKRRVSQVELFEDPGDILAEPAPVEALLDRRAVREAMPADVDGEDAEALRQRLDDGFPHATAQPRRVHEDDRAVLGRGGGTVAHPLMDGEGEARDLYKPDDWLAHPSPSPRTALAR